MPAEGLTWDKTPEEAFSELWESYSYTLFVSGARIGSRRAEEMQAWMKQNAPWTDRTGVARASLFAVAEADAVRVAQITAGYGPEAWYGVWLEIAYGGKWAIVSKTIDYWGPIVWKDIQNMMNLGLIAVGD